MTTPTPKEGGWGAERMTFLGREKNAFSVESGRWRSSSR